MKGIDGALELWIPDRDLGGGRILAFAAGVKKICLLVVGECGSNVWTHAMLVDELAAGSEILRRGEAGGRAVGQRDDALNRAFAEGGFPDDECAVEVLERAGDDLRSAGAGIVGENDDGVFAVRAGCRRGPVFPRGRSAFRINDERVRR